MSDIELVPTSTEFGEVFDFGLENNDLKLEEGLRTAIAISLFTDKRVSKDEVSTDQNQRGWWADVISEIKGDEIGSKLWLLEREKQTPEILTRAIGYAKEALNWLIEDEVASTIEVTASFPMRGFLSIAVFITKPNGEKLNYIFDNAWKVEGLK